MQISPGQRRAVCGPCVPSGWTIPASRCEELRILEDDDLNDFQYIHIHIYSYIYIHIYLNDFWLPLLDGEVYFCSLSKFFFLTSMDFFFASNMMVDVNRKEQDVTCTYCLDLFSVVWDSFCTTGIKMVKYQ